MFKTGRRSALWAGITGIATLLVGNKAQAAPPKPVGLTWIKCCGTCGHMGNQHAASYTFRQGEIVFAVPLFGWCDLVPKPALPEGNPHVIYCDMSVNRHFLMTCPKWQKAKKGS
jgi:hypothetical protein